MPILTVQAQDETTEIFVVATDFALRARGARRLKQDLEPGIYKVRAVSGRSEWQRVVVLRDNMNIDVPTIEFGSAAPLAHTSRTHETHMSAAEQAAPPDLDEDTHAAFAHSAGPASRPSHSGSLVFMARWWTPWHDSGPQKLNDPAWGASLATGGGRRLMSLASRGEGARYEAQTEAGSQIAPVATWFSGDLAQDRYSGVSLRAHPGIYTLGLYDGEGKSEQPITILPGWRTHVFALYEPSQGGGGDVWTGPRKRLVDISVHITRGGLSVSDDIVRLTDAARFALADERSSATSELLNYVRGKFQNPMLGLYGAHLLLLLKQKASAASIERPVGYDDGLFHEVLENTASLFGEDHPDIAALRGKDARTETLRFPPMLSHGWKNLLDASADRPELVPPRLWRRTAQRTQTEPFFAWRIPQYQSEQIMLRQIDLTRAVLDAAAEQERYDPDAAGLRDRAADSKIRDSFVRDCITRFEAPRSVIDMIL